MNSEQTRPVIALAMGDPAGMGPELTAQAAGIAAEGPFPADTVFLRVKDDAFDAVLTM